MEGIDRLAWLLVTEKRFRPVTPGPDQAHLLSEPPQFDFVGTRGYWGSNTAIALVHADGLEPAAMERFAERFYALISANPSWLGGSFGLIGYVFDRSPTSPIVDYVRKLKRRNVHQKVWMGAWTLDLSTGRVHPHRGGPYGLYPGRGWVEKAIRRELPER